jgi:predicted ATP-grasp superfamily ATP-dependent carboligase
MRRGAAVQIFAWEYLTSGGGRALGAAASMMAEGGMMIRALTRDLAAIPEVRTRIARDPVVDLGVLTAAIETISAGDPLPAWQRIVRSVEAVWPVAPETGGILEEVTRLILRSERILLGSRLDALAIARSKLATVRHLAAQDLPVVPTVALGDPLPCAAAGWVVKPDDGAGATDTYRFSEAEVLRRWAAKRRAGGWIIQPFIPGTAASLTILAQGGAGWLLSCNIQHVDGADGSFTYRGGVVGGAEERRRAYEPLAEGIVAGLPGLWGLIGVDLIDGRDGPLLLEVNPRLTTSYVGLAESIGLNPAALVLALRERPIAGLRRRLAPRPVEIALPS